MIPIGGRVEVITGPERRRRWSDEEKLQLVAEACRPGNPVLQVARQRGISASQLFGWRRQALAKGLITDHRPEPSAVLALTFALVEVAEEPTTPDARKEVRPARRRKTTRTSSIIEIELESGDRVRVEGCTDAGLVARIIGPAVSPHMMCIWFRTDVLMSRPSWEHSRRGCVDRYDI